MRSQAGAPELGRDQTIGQRDLFGETSYQNDSHSIPDFVARNRLARMLEPDPSS